MSEEYDEVYEDLDLELGSNGDAAAPSPEELREQIRQEMEAEFQEHKARFEAAERQRLGQRLREEAGIEWGDDDDLRPVDPLRASQFAARLPNAEPEFIPDPTYQPEEFAEWFQRQSAQVAAEAVKQAVEPLQRQLEQVGGWAMRPLSEGLAETAREALAGYGMDAFAESPEYVHALTQTVQQAIRAGQLPAEALSDPEALAPVALMLAPQFRGQVRASASPGRSAPGAFLPSDVSRAGLRTMQPSRGTGPGRGGYRVSDADRFGMELTGIQDPRLWAALDADADPDEYVRQRRAQLAKQKGR